MGNAENPTGITRSPFPAVSTRHSRGPEPSECFADGYDVQDDGDFDILPGCLITEPSSSSTVTGPRHDVRHYSAARMIPATRR